MIVYHLGLSENSVPRNRMVLLIIIPIKWLFHWEYTDNIPNIFRQTHISILESLQTSNSVKKHLSALRPGGRMMLFQRMSYDSDSKEPQEIFSIPETGTATPKT